MPTKNFFLSPPSLTPTHSLYQFLYHTCKTPLYPSHLPTSTLLNCNPNLRDIHCSIDSLYSVPSPSSSMMLNHRTLWMHNGMPSSLCRHLRHLSHLSHLNTLTPHSLDTALPDSYCEVFITEINPKDLGLSEGCFTDDLLIPLPMSSPLLPQPQDIDALTEHSLIS
jgi:hypothetical protein